MAPIGQHLMLTCWHGSIERDMVRELRPIPSPSCRGQGGAQAKPSNTLTVAWTIMRRVRSETGNGVMLGLP